MKSLTSDQILCSFKRRFRHVHVSTERAFRVGSKPEPYYYCVSFKQLIHKIATLSRATGELVATLHRTHKCERNFYLLLLIRYSHVKNKIRFIISKRRLMCLQSSSAVRTNVDFANEVVSDCSLRFIGPCYGINMC